MTGDRVVTTERTQATDGTLIPTGTRGRIVRVYPFGAVDVRVGDGRIAWKLVSVQYRIVRGRVA